MAQMGADRDVPHFRFSGPPADFFHLAAMVSFLLLAEAWKRQVEHGEVSSGSWW